MSVQLSDLRRSEREREVCADGNCVGKGDMRAQMEQTFQNLDRCLKAAGATWADVVKTSTFVTDFDEFQKCADVRMRYHRAPVSERHKKVTVNEAKSAVARPEERKFLGFSISNDGSERRIAPKALDKFKMQIRDLTRRTRGISLPQLIEDLTPYLIGWRGYFGFCQTPRVLTNLEAWIRRRLRSYLWRQWQNGRNRFKELRRRGVPKFHAAVAAALQAPRRSSFGPLSDALSGQRLIYRHEDRMPDFTLDVLRQMSLAGGVLDQDHLTDTDCGGSGFLDSGIS